MYSNKDETSQITHDKVQYSQTNFTVHTASAKRVSPTEQVIQLE